MMREVVVRMLFEDERNYKPKNVRSLQKLEDARKHVPLGSPNGRRSGQQLDFRFSETHFGLLTPRTVQ